MPEFPAIRARARGAPSTPLIAGLIERRFPGQEKTGRQVTFSSDLIYNVLREHEPDHILLRATFKPCRTFGQEVERHAADGESGTRCRDYVSFQFEHLAAT